LIVQWKTTAGTGALARCSGFWSLPMLLLLLMLSISVFPTLASISFNHLVIKTLKQSTLIATF